MAEDFDSRTEPATPRRREEARAQGQVAFSHELVTGVLLLAATGMLALGAGRLGTGLLSATRVEILAASVPEMTANQAQGLLARVFGQCLAIVGPLLALLFGGGLAACVMQVGVQPSASLLALNWERVSPFGGMGRLFSMNSAVKGLIALLRLAVVAVLVWWALRGQAAPIAALGDMPLRQAVGHAWAIVLRVAMAIAGGLLLLGIGDYFFQFWRLERSLRMSRQELKDEAKRDEGDPLVKARVRRLQREAAKKKMFHEVRQATVVLTNPTHLAIALRYDRGTMTAPKVVAKGAGHVAKRIVELARGHGVPVLERKTLARAMYRAVKLNQEIPLGLYQAVAEVLAHVYRQRNAA